MIELLVVVAIIALLISILLPSLQKARESSKAAVCASGIHQLMLATHQYAEDHSGRLPWIPGSPASQFRNAPYEQYQQLIIFWPYLKDRKIFRCPSARDENSVKILYGETIGSNPNDPTNAGASHYFVRKSDEAYLNLAYRENWWPDQNPMDLGDQEEFPDLYTEYWYNDFTSSLVQAGGGNTALRDGAGKPLPPMNGGTMEKIPFPAYAVPMAEYGWALPAEKLRHNGGINIGFIDGSARRFVKQRYYDLNGRAATPADRPQDMDGYGNRPFYAWGLSRDGRDFLQ